MEYLMQLFQIAFIAIGTWGLTNGLMVHKALRKKKKTSHAAEALYKSNIAMSLNAACFMLLIVESIIWPSTQDPTAPAYAQALSGGAFLGSTTGLSYALHKMRCLLIDSPDDEK